MFQVGKRMSPQLQPARTSSNHCTTSRPRSSYCTHRNLTRIYDKHNCQRCTVCQRVPHFGYLYRCTQETNGHLPVTDFVDENLAIDLGTLGLHDRSPATNSPPDNSSPISSPDSAPQNFLKESSIHTEGTMTPSTATDELLAHACDGKRKFETAFPPEKAHQQIRCGLKICHACRPIYKERAWQSLEKVVNTPPTFPSQLEFDNRRVSDASIIMRMQPANKLVLTGNKPHSRVQSQRSAGLSTAKHDKVPILGYVSHSKNNNLHRMCLKMQQSLQIDNPSDADDEKGSELEDDSDFSTANDGYLSTSHSDSEDLLPVTNLLSSVPRPASVQREMTPTDLEKTPLISVSQVSPKRRAHKDELRRSVLKDNFSTDNSRPYHGRFEID